MCIRDRQKAEVLNLLSSTASQVENDDGCSRDTICRDFGDDEFPSLFQRVAGSSSGRQSGLSAPGSAAAADSSGGSCGGGGIHRHRAVWRAEDRTAATVSALCEPVSYTHLRAHETVLDLVCRLLLEK